MQTQSQVSKQSHWYGIYQRQSLFSRLSCLEEICRQYEIENEAKASHMLETVKRRFQSVLMKQVRQTVLNSQVVEDELKEILKFFEKESEI